MDRSGRCGLAHFECDKCRWILSDRRFSRTGPLQGSRSWATRIAIWTSHRLLSLQLAPERYWIGSETCASGTLCARLEAWVSTAFLDAMAAFATTRALRRCASKVALQRGMGLQERPYRGDRPLLPGWIVHPSFKTAAAPQAGYRLGGFLLDDRFFSDPRQVSRNPCNS